MGGDEELRLRFSPLSPDCAATAVFSTAVVFVLVSVLVSGSAVVVRAVVCRVSAAAVVLGSVVFAAPVLVVACVCSPVKSSAENTLTLSDDFTVTYAYTNKDGAKTSAEKIHAANNAVILFFICIFASFM